jgi:predicted enzyme related to lactoylglutathione lyase
MIKGIDVVFIHSPNSDLGNWYSQVFGLSKGYWDQHWQELQTSIGSRFAIDITSSFPSDIEKQHVIISFLVDDIQQAVNKLVEKGVKFYPSREKTIFDAGSSLVATFQDPDGNWMQLSQKKSV